MSSYQHQQIIRKTCFNALNLFLLVKLVKKRKKSRRWWVKPHLKNEIRTQFGAYHTIFKYFKLNDHGEFFKFMHMSTEQFSNLYELMEQNIIKQTTNLRKPLHPELRLCFFLWFIAHGGSISQAASMFHIGISTAYALVKDISRDIINVLNALYVQRPTIEKWIQISNSYQQLWDFPNCIGALDGKHIEIEQPPLAGSFFWSYKKKHSFVLMAIVDAKKSFIWYDVGDFGSLNDASIFSDTDFAQKLLSDELDIPPPRSLPNTNIKMPFMFIADEIFALSKNFMKSYSKSTHLTVEERVFNHRLKRARLCVECSFGIISKKFQILQQKLKFDLTTSRFVVAAIICLHNFLIATNPEDNAVDLNEILVENIHNEEYQDLQMTPIQQRQLLSAYFSSDAGLVDWQHEYI